MSVINRFECLSPLSIPQSGPYPSSWITIVQHLVSLSEGIIADCRLPRPQGRMFGCMAEVTEYRISPGRLDKSEGNRIS
jgi:hypothetical protein